MAQTKKQNPYMMLIHLVIGVVVAFAFSKITPPGQITPMGMALIGTFLVTNYWFITIDMITGSLASMVMFPLLSGVAAGGVVTSTLGNTTVWQMLVVLPLIYALKKSGATDYLANWMMTRKFMYGKSTMFVMIFLILASLISALKVHTLVVLALAEGVMTAAGYEERTKEHDAFMVATFFASALASNVIPYGSWIASFITSYESIAGEPLDTALYMGFGIVLNIVLDIVYVLVMKFILRCNYSKLADIKMDAVKGEEHKLSKKGKVMLILFLIMILGAVIPALFRNWAVSKFLSGTLTTALWFTACAVVCFAIRIDGEPIVSAGEAMKNGVAWPMILSAAVMLYYAGLVGGADSGIRPTLTAAFAGIFDGMPGVLLLLVACLLTVIVTGFFSNMATGVIFMSATIPLAAAFNLAPLALGVCIMWASMPGFITPGGTGTAPYLHGLTSITKKNMYKYMLAFLVAFLVIILIFGAVMNIIL